ncbi:MAG: HDIG domain-containing protein [Spirochaetales bacterium]|nr:HDIG domain-containing protein [Spirochaetales bacterium]
MKTKPSKEHLDPVGFSSLRRETQTERYTIVILLIGLLAVLLLNWLFLHGNDFFPSGKYPRLETGEIAQQDVYADFTLTYVNEEATEERKEARRQLVWPVFRIDPDIPDKIVDKIEGSRRLTLSFLEQKDGEQNADLYGNQLYYTIQERYPDLLRRETVQTILSSEDPETVFSIARTGANQLYSKGIVSVPREEILGHPGIELRHYGDKGTDSLEVSKSDILKYPAEAEQIRKRISQTQRLENMEEQVLDAAAMLLEDVLRPNAFFDKTATNEKINNQLTSVDPVTRTINEGDRIIKRGFPVTDTQTRDLDVLRKHSTTFNARQIAGDSIYIIIVFSLVYLVFISGFLPFRITRFQLTTLLIMMTVFYAITVVVERFIPLPESLLPAVVLPTALLAMILSVLMNREPALLFGVLVSFLLVSVTYDLFDLLFAFLSSALGIVLILGVMRRIEFIKAGLYLGVGNMVILFVLGFMQSRSIPGIWHDSPWAFLNGFVGGILLVGLLPIFEHVLNTATRFRLMELSNINAPIIKRMLTLAPGTYSHSLNVANLAESACEAIGANALLARVSAYYHDIGKIDQAEYFDENQSGTNKHDSMKPGLSAAVIKSHVKIGVEKAKELNLPKEVITIIAQHHGDQVISHFYNRAVTQQGRHSVAPENFAYQSSPPTSKEAAVVLLADSTEAASRSLQEPNSSKLEKLIQDVIDSKVRMGQLEKCPLTIRDLDLIRKSFFKILAGHFHTRLVYPEAERKKA